LYRRTDEGNAYYAFNTKTDELIYKIVIYKADSWGGMIDKLTANRGAPTKRRADSGVMTYFWRIGDDAGVKVSNNPDFEDTFQVWYGSISLWNKLAYQVNGLSIFAK
jgi:hypothetical protein